MNLLKVWIVDDEPLMCSGVDRALRDYEVRIDNLAEEATFEITSFSSAEDFFEAHKTSSPDILLLDIKLPGVEGTQVLEQLSKERSKILTIMITAYASLDKAVNAIKLGAYDFLAKPFTPNELRTTIKKTAHNILLSRKMEQLELANKKIRFELISIVSHELKAPINAVEGYIDMLENDEIKNNPDLIAKSMERMSLRIQDMRKLITDLLDLTRIESGQMERHLEMVNIKEVINGVMEENKEQCLKLNIDLSFNPVCECTYYSDKNEMEIVFKNLISNAVKYNCQDGRVVITLEEDDIDYIIKVEDTGIGIAEGDINKLFKEFSRIKNEKTRSIGGSGLGLSIVSKIVERYHGSIKATSRLGEGTIFTLRLKKEQ